MKRYFISVLVLSGLTVSACATPQQLEMIEREQKRLRAESASTAIESTAVRREFETIRSSLADTRANLNQLQRDLNVLKEKMEEVRYQMDGRISQSSREGSQRIKELEVRIAKIDDDLKAQGALLKVREEELRILQEAARPGQGSKEAPVSKGADAPTGIARDKVAGESEAVRKDYEEAMKLLDRKDYKTAIVRFRDFLKKFPKSDLADNAQYWIGESHYALKEFDQAILAFDEVERQYPNGDKVPAALLKQGFAFAELGDKVDARLILKKLIDRYPQSQEAVKAKQKLKTLES
ncbi:MAG: tol-pal system protein YbgF [Candidatus Binatia bacterium]